MSRLQLSAGALSDIGNFKKVNQDNILVQIGEGPYGEFGLMVVCDGVGGLSHGEIASSIAINAFKLWWKNEVINIISLDSEKIIKSMEEVVNKINSRIINAGRQNNSLYGTTLSAMFIYEDKYYIVHVGDSRIYKLEHDFKQLTEDHSLIAYQLKNMIINEKEAAESAQKHVLVQCVGAKEKIEIYKSIGSVGKREFFLLCTDGFYNKLDINELKKDITKSKATDNGRLQKISRNAVEKIKSKGEKDNISVILVHSQQAEDKSQSNLFSRFFRGHLL